MMNELRAGAPITLAGMILIPIERVQVNSEKQSFGYWLNATKEAVAIVICEPQGPRLMNISIEEHSLDRIFTELPELVSICFNHSDLNRK
jgi:uncharacterized spore protein YtfJ